MFISINAYGLDFFTRPLTLAILAMIVFLAARPYLQRLWKRRKNPQMKRPPGEETPSDQAPRPHHDAGDPSDRNLYTLEALQFPGNAKIVPTIFGGLAIVVVVIQLLAPRIKAFRTLSGELKVDDDRDLDVFRDPAARRRLLLISASLLAIPLLIAVFGLPLALPLYVAAMLLGQRQRIYDRDRVHRRDLGDVLRTSRRAPGLALERRRACGRSSDDTRWGCRRGDRRTSGRQE
jgi:hypothetical protein